MGALTAYENESRLLNLSGLTNLGPEGYAALAPIQWPVDADGRGTDRLFVDGRFQTPDGRARMVPTRPRGPADAVDAVYPLSLNTGRIRDQWHTMTRTGLAPDLCRHAPEPFVEIHPVDAEAAGLKEGMLARVITARGEAVALAKLTDRQRPGGVFMPMHWTDAFAPSGRSNPLIAPNIDPVSGQPEFKHTPARIRAYRETWKGFFLSRDTLKTPLGQDLVWRRIPQDACQQHEFAGRGDASERDAVRKALSKGLIGEVVAYDDIATGARREAWVRDGRLVAVLFMTTTGRLPPRDWLADLFAEPVLDRRSPVSPVVRPPAGRAGRSGPAGLRMPEGGRQGRAGRHCRRRRDARRGRRGHGGGDQLRILPTRNSANDHRHDQGRFRQGDRRCRMTCNPAVFCWSAPGRAPSI
jgi:assimilatory nitrate reductase catalytic subunit